MARENVRSLKELPSELQTEIFLRLPLSCLLICKCVCKSFCTIIQNPNFTNTHYTRTRAIATHNNTSQELLLGFRDDAENIHTHILFTIDNTTKEVLSSLPLTPHIPYVGDLRLVGSCNGLICFSVKFPLNCDDHVFLLWNPVTTHTKYLPKSRNTSYSPENDIMEFGFVPETNDYIVLRFVSLTGSTRFQVELYKMSTDSWKIVERNSAIGDYYLSNFSLDLYRSRTALFLNGCFHWISSCDNLNNILSFNLKDEDTKVIQALDSCDMFFFEYHVEWDLSIIEESLAAIYTSEISGHIQIWVMEDYWVQDSWVLRFQISTPTRQMSCWKNNLMYYDLNTLHLYDLNTGKKKKLPHSKTCYPTAFSTFVDTLAPVRCGGRSV